MTQEVSESHSTGLWGPVALLGGSALLLAAPLMRGGNRYVALVPLELLGLVVLTALWACIIRAWRGWPHAQRVPALQIAALILSPVVLGLIQLTPLPADWWARLPAHDIYARTLADAGVPGAARRPLSVSPDATAASLLAAIPLAAIFLLAYLSTLGQLRVMLRVVVAVAIAEVVLGLLQISGGQHSPLFFGVMTYGPPVGTFANRNHFANYIAMALAAYVWLAYEAARGRQRGGESSQQIGSFSGRHATALWVAGGLVLVLGILMSRSRGAALFGLPMAALGLAVAALRINGWTRGWRFAAPIAVLLVVAAAAIIGFDSVTSRITGDQLASSADFRNALARTSMEGAVAFWPWGSGWGTYDVAYPRFQPASLAVYANHAHQDYVEMLFEGGIFFVLPAALFLWLAVRRAWLLGRTALRDRTLDREAMAAALCGLGLLGFLLHSLVEFNMRIPANAILGALLAGTYLRPLLSARHHRHDRPAQPHPPRH